MNDVKVHVHQVMAILTRSWRAPYLARRLGYRLSYEVLRTGKKDLTFQQLLLGQLHVLLPRLKFQDQTSWFVQDPYVQDVYVNDS